MPRDASGNYVRVTNSFSNPVTATVISSTDADALFDDFESAMNMSAIKTPKYLVTSASLALPNEQVLIAGAGLTSTTTASQRVIAIGAGSGITVNAADVQLSTINPGYLLANTSAGTAAPTGTSLSAIFDAVLGSTQGAVIHRSTASGWTLLEPGSAGQFLRTNGPSANVTWVTIPGGGDMLAANNLSDVANIASARVNLGLGYGKQTIWIPAAAMTPNTTNGAVSGAVETSANKVMLPSLNFDDATQQFAEMNVQMPKSWNLGTVTFVPVWSHAATASASQFGVVWGLDAVAVHDQASADVAFGTEQTSQDTGGAVPDKIYLGPESAAITIAGSPATSDFVLFRVHRDPATATDTLPIKARLHGVSLFYTNAAGNDN